MDPPTVTIEWDTPATGGSSLTYRITIPLIGYVREETSTAHTITADGIQVLFNTAYNVMVTAVTALGRESAPITITVTFTASRKIFESSCLLMY